MKYQIMFYGGLIGTVISLTLAIFIFFKYEIPQVLSDLTGFRFSKRRKRNALSHYSQGNREIYQTSSEIQIRKERRHAGELSKSRASMNPTDTTVLLQNDVPEETVLLDFNETVPLDDSYQKNEEDSFILEESVVIIHATKILTFNRREVFFTND